MSAKKLVLIIICVIIGLPFLLKVKRFLTPESLTFSLIEQKFAATAPVNLIYVADFGKMKGDDETKQFYSATDTGFISQNVYLYCAAEGLGTVVRGWVDKEHLAGVMQLRPEQHVILAQTVGYIK